jgi:cell division protein FtsZ
MNAFQVADDVLRRGVQSITELINIPEYINLDFADVTAIMKDAGYAHMGVGEASGKDKASEAAKSAISSPLLETTISGARGILISITASPDIALEDIDIASDFISSEAAEDATVIWGAAFDETLEDTMRVTIIATGFENKNEADSTFKKNFDSKIKPVAAGKIKAGVKEQINVSGAKAEPEVQAEPDPNAVLTDEEFDDILKMLNIGKNQNNPPRRY